MVSMIKRKHFSIRIASVVRFHASRTIVYISSLCLHSCPLLSYSTPQIATVVLSSLLFLVVVVGWWWGGVCACYTAMKAWEHSGIVDQTLPHRGMQIVSHYKHSTHADIMKWVFMKTLISNTVLAFIYLLFPCCERNMGDLTTLTRTFTLSMGIRCKYKLDCS